MYTNQIMATECKHVKENPYFWSGLGYVPWVWKGNISGCLREDSIPVGIGVHTAV